VNIPTQPTSQHDGILGALPTMWYGTSAIDADASPWVNAPMGSIYFTPTGNWTKGTNGWAIADAGVDGAVDGQEFIVQINTASTTFVHNGAVGSETPFAMNGSANKTAATNDCFHFVVVGGFAREVRRA